MARARIVDLGYIYILVLARLSKTQARITARGSSESDPYVSNGTCYYGVGKLADASYIPCGNTAFGTFSCCEAGSNCLDHNACYSSDGNTYLAGCTDPLYEDESCPDKSPYEDQQWTGLVYCNGTSDEWTLCDDSSSGSDTVTVVPGCWCPEDESSRYYALSAPGTIASQIKLPASNGGTMSFYDGYSARTVPTAPATTAYASASASAAASSSSNNPTTTSSTMPSGPTTLASSSSSSAASSSSSTAPLLAQSNSGLSTGAKIGIGIGTSMGGLVALAVIGAMAFYIRRLKQRQYGPGDGTTTTRPRSELPAMEKDHLDGLAQRGPGWSGNTSELAGDSSRNLSSVVSPESTQRSWSRPISTEIDGSIQKYQSMASLQSQELGDGRPVYRTYRGAEEMPLGVHGVPPAAAAATSSTAASQASYWPGRQVGNSGVYEMPAQLPGSSFLDREGR